MASLQSGRNSGGSTSSQTSSSSNSHGSTAAGASAEECEFLIAADLTLYANPLRCLQPKKPAQGSVKKQDNHKNEKSKDGGGNGGAGAHTARAKGISDQSDRYNNDCNTMIAADLVKYGSPLDG